MYNTFIVAVTRNESLLTGNGWTFMEEKEEMGVPVLGGIVLVFGVNHTAGSCYTHFGWHRVL